MIVYRSEHLEVDVQAALAKQRRCLDGRPDADTLLAAFLRFSELETGLTDAASPTIDELNPLTASLRVAALALACAYLRAVRRGPDAGAALEAARRAHAAVAARHLPRSVPVSTPEGYAFYGLHPLAYVEAAERFARGAPGRAVCIGLRSIGTSLSAMVGAALVEQGWTVVLHTLRPRGHPFARRPVLGPQLAEAWRREVGPFLVVDERPGVSGSSMCGTADALNALGVADQRIVLFPSWDAQADRLLSPAARARWLRQRKLVAHWQPPGFLAHGEDLSAGAWRTVLFPADGEPPAVQPQHERRKYRLQTDEGTRIYRFAGLAHYGATKLERSAVLAEAGFGPTPGALREGYLDQACLTGQPLRAGEATRAFLDTVAHYLAFLRRRFALTHAAPHHSTATMLQANTGELLGERWVERATALARGTAAADAPAVALDGRMSPHEWLDTPQGFRKLDALDHHADHFFPGCNDIAWDLAAVSEEFHLSREAREVLLTRYAQLSGDGHVRARLPFQRAAYLAHRLGYAKLAAQTLGDTPDGHRFHALTRHYRARLCAALTR
ncbi:MAG: hypothetical protein M0R77_15220 [Gammaproteobacteria bacterium]|nr:hypothetical protein [Gammaproteobacteria bacterium]